VGPYLKKPFTKKIGLVEWLKVKALSLGQIKTLHKKKIGLVEWLKVKALSLSHSTTNKQNKTL
jgi:hypothetical protein